MSAIRFQAHQPAPEPRWRWWAGALAEMAVLLAIVAFCIALASLQS